MATPQIEPQTKKAFNFPKGAARKNAASADGAKPAKSSKKPQVKESAKPEATATSARPAAKKKVAEKKAVATKPVAKKAKQAAKPEIKPEAQAAQASASQAAAKTKTKRVKKEKVVRDSFTMPKSDYAKLASLKQKCQDNGLRVKKSELLRAALAMLDAAPEKRIVAAIKALETVKTGRPANA